MLAFKSNRLVVSACNLLLAVHLDSILQRKKCIQSPTAQLTHIHTTKTKRRIPQKIVEQLIICSNKEILCASNRFSCFVSTIAILCTHLIYIRNRLSLMDNTNYFEKVKHLCYNICVCFFFFASAMLFHWNPFSHMSNTKLQFA